MAAMAMTAVAMRAAVARAAAARAVAPVAAQMVVAARDAEEEGTNGLTRKPLSRAGLEPKLASRQHSSRAMLLITHCEMRTRVSNKFRSGEAAMMRRGTSEK